MRAKVNATNNVPSAPEFFLEALLDVLSCILEVLELASDEQSRHILGDQQCVLLHIGLHVAVFDVEGQWDVGADPIFGDACSCCLLLAVLRLFDLFLRFFWHKLYFNYHSNQNDSYTNSTHTDVFILVGLRVNNSKFKCTTTSAKSSLTVSKNQ